MTGSIADITFVAKRKTSVQEINEIFKKAAGSLRWKGILKATEDQIVSSDIIGEPYGAIVDLKFTKVVDGDLVKILSWYDNEWGYVAMLVRHLLAISKSQILNQQCLFTSALDHRFELKESLKNF